MITTEIIKEDILNQEQLNEIVDFLFKNLGSYGDPKADIRNAGEYALARNGKPGGFIVTIRNQKTMVGAAVINYTAMSGYIPENQLVYLAVHSDQRRNNIGKQLMQTILDTIEGDIALHVEKDNPARSFYEKFGFTTPYLEMRKKG